MDVEFMILCLSKAKEEPISNYQRLTDRYIACKPPEKLAQALNELVSNFDGPILGFGLQLSCNKAT